MFGKDAVESGGKRVNTEAPRAGSDSGAASDEAELVARAQAGDSQAFGRLYQRYVDRVYSFIAFRVRDTGTAEDLTQEVFVQALKGLTGFDWRGSLAPWLLRIARNAVIDHWRRTQRRPESTLTSLEPEGDEGDESHGLDRLVSVPDDADVRAGRVLDREKIVAAARHLTELQQQVLALRFASGLSIKESAEVMGKSEGAVKNLQHHALKGLKRHLKDHD